MAVFFQSDTPTSWRRMAPERNIERDVSGDTRLKLAALMEELRRPETTEARKQELMKSVWQTQLMVLGETGDEKVREILKWRSSFEAIRSIDLLSLKRQGIPLYEYLLFKKKWGPAKKEDLQSNEEFLVNFWDNKYMRDSVGAGDILPAEVSDVEINGKRAQRKNIWWRPWYYAKEWSQWLYRPIYDGDTVKIIHIWPIDTEQIKRNKEVEESFFKQKTMEDILENIRLWKDARKELGYLSDAEYKESLEYAEQIQKERADRALRMPKTKSESEFLKNYGEYLDSICAQLKVPQEVMLAIFRKETNWFNIQATNKDTGAHWIGQIIPSTWAEIQDKTLPKYWIHGKLLDRNDIRDQILAATCYIRDRADVRGGSIEKGIMWYFWVSSANFESAKASNPSVYSLMQANWLSWPEGFEQAYIIWLWLRPGNIPTTYNTDWKIQLPKEEYDPIGLPYGLSAKVTSENWKKITWCGYTARENGDSFWANFPPIYNSSQALTKYSGDTSIRASNPLVALTHAKEAGMNVMDIVFENSRWSEMWHRACGIIAKNGSCYVYDPYFALGRSDTRTAIPYETYMKAMIEGEWKTLVWFWLHTSNHPALKKS